MPQVRISGTPNEQSLFRVQGVPVLRLDYDKLAELFSHFPSDLGQDVENSEVGTIDPQEILDGAPDVTHPWSAPAEVMGLVNLAIKAKEMERQVVWY